MDLDIRHLRQFLAVAEQGSFSVAANKLGMSQPPLSQAIAKLERKLDCQLFLRTSRKVELTERGLLLQAEAIRLVKRHAEMLDALDRAAKGITGHLRVAFVMSVGSAYLPQILRQFRARFPDVSLKLEEVSTANQVTALSDDLYDIGLLRPPIFGGSALTLRTLVAEPLMLALPQQHPLAQEADIDLRAFAKADFIAPPAALGLGLHTEIVSLCLAAGFTPRIAQEAKQMQTIASLVSGGLGVAILPQAVATLGLKGVTYRPITQPNGAKTEIALAWQNAALRRRPHLGSFIEIAEDVCRGENAPSTTRRNRSP